MYDVLYVCDVYALYGASCDSDALHVNGVYAFCEYDVLHGDVLYDVSGVYDVQVFYGVNGDELYVYNVCVLHDVRASYVVYGVVYDDSGVRVYVYVHAYDVRHAYDAKSSVSPLPAW